MPNRFQFIRISGVDADSGLIAELTNLCIRYIKKKYNITHKLNVRDTSIPTGIPSYANSRSRNAGMSSGASATKRPTDPIVYEVRET